MLKASALYIVIVMALVMAVLCSALIAAAYFYRQQYSQTLRMVALQHNLTSGINILLESGKEYTTSRTFSLFSQGADTVRLQQQPWGVFDISTAESFIQQDTVRRAFLMAHQLDSTKWATLYVIEEDRSLSVSGKTMIRGTAYLPKAGIREAYVNNQAYQGDKRIISGLKRNSSKALPPLSSERLSILKQLQQLPVTDTLLSPGGNYQQSFFAPVRVLRLPKSRTRLSGLQLQGHVILYSDTAIVLDSTVKLDGALVFAKVITLKSGFQGQGQLFASDSIRVERGCRLTYPSVLGILNYASGMVKGQPKISLGEGSQLWGSMFIYQQTPNLDLLPLVDLQKKVIVSGQVYVPGLLNYQEGVVINGSAYVNRFLYQTDYTRYENYLIGLRLDGPALSHYYLTPELLPVAAASQRVLQWVK